MTPVFLNFHDFLLMGGYGRYVWIAYGLMLVILFLNLFFPMRRHSKLITKLRGKR